MTGRSPKNRQAIRSQSCRVASTTTQHSDPCLTPDKSHSDLGGAASPEIVRRLAARLYSGKCYLRFRQIIAAAMRNQTREAHREGDTLVLGGADCNLAIVGVDDLLDHIQPQPEVLCP